MVKDDEILKTIILIHLKTGLTFQEIINKTCEKINIPQGSIKVIPRE